MRRLFENTRFWLWGSVVVSIFSVFDTVRHRMLLLDHAQQFIFLREGEPRWDTPPWKQYGVPGGWDWAILDKGGIFLNYMANQAFMLSCLFLVLYSLRSMRKVVDYEAFGMVDERKIRILGLNLKIAYGVLIFAITLAALSFLFDTSVTMSIYVGTSAPFIEDYVRIIAEYHPWIFSAGVAISFGMALWWSKTLEFPRDVEFRTS